MQLYIDYKKNKVLTEFNAEEKDTKRTATLLNAINNIEKADTPPVSDPSYIIHLIDKGDSQYDAWINIYIDGNKLYSQYDTEKTESHGLDLTSEISLCTDVTPEEFLSVLE